MVIRYGQEITLAIDIRVVCLKVYIHESLRRDIVENFTAYRVCYKCVVLWFYSLRFFCWVPHTAYEYVACRWGRDTYKASDVSCGPRLYSRYRGTDVM